MHISQNVYWIHDNINYYLLIVLSVYCSIFPVLLRFVSVEFYAVNTFSVGKNARIFTICPYSLLKIRCFVEYIYSKTIYYKTFNSFSKKNVKKKKNYWQRRFYLSTRLKIIFFFFFNFNNIWYIDQKTTPTYSVPFHLQRRPTYPQCNYYIVFFFVNIFIFHYLLFNNEISK